MRIVIQNEIYHTGFFPGSPVITCYMTCEPQFFLDGFYFSPTWDSKYYTVVYVYDSSIIPQGYYWTVLGQNMLLFTPEVYFRGWMAAISPVPGMLVNLAGGGSLGKISVAGAIAVAGAPQLEGSLTLGKISVSGAAAVLNPVSLAGSVLLGAIADSGDLHVVSVHINLGGILSLGNLSVAGSISVGPHVDLAGSLTIGKLLNAATIDEGSGPAGPWWYFADDTFTAPATANYAVYCLGAGGPGGGGFLAGGPSGGAGGGGGAGAFAYDVVSLTMGDTIGVTVGTSAAPGPSEFGAAVIADYGGPGFDGTAIAPGTGGLGGNPANCMGSSIFAGGNGGDGFSTLGGGGAGSASDASNGNNGGPGTLVGGVGASGVGGGIIAGQGGGDGALATANGYDAPPGSPSSWGGGGGGGGGQAFSGGGAPGGGVVLVIQL